MLMDRSADSSSIENLVRILGGLENMADKYPEMYKAYQRTRAAHEKGLKLTSKVSAVNFFIAGIGYADDTKTKIYLDYYAVCDEESNGACDVMLLSLRAVKKNELTPLSAEQNDMVFQGNMKINRVIINIESASLNDVKLVSDFYAIGNQIESLNCYAPLDTYHFDASASFVVNHPAHQKTAVGSSINIEYHRRWRFDEENRDYFYDDNAIGGDYNTGFFTLDNDGSLAVLNAQVKEVSTKRLDYWVNDIQVAHPFGENSVKIQGNTIRWTLTPRTDIRLNYFLPYTSGVNLIYNMYYEVLLTNGKRAPFRITNDPDVPESTPNVKKLDPIYLFCDCLLKGTEITMEDGSKRKIETLSAGDRVKTGPSSSAAIKKTGGGTNTIPVVTIMAENGSSVKVSYSHTIVTEKGLRHSQLVQAGDVLFAPDGTTTRAKSVGVSGVQTCELRYIELDCADGRLYIDGIQAGDSTAVLTDNEKYTNKYYSLPENWRKDFESWNSMKNGKNQ